MSQDQEQKYGGIWTKKGLEKLAAFAAGGNPINITESAFGDGNGTVPTPEAENTSLVHEVWRGRVASVTQKEGENSQSVMVEVVIPYNVGGFFIREWGLYDADGDLVVYGNHAEFYKALLIEGTGAELRELIELPISSKGQVQITVNYESLASVDYVLNEIEKHNQNEEAHKEQFGNVVHKKGDENIDDIKTFLKGIINLLSPDLDLSITDSNNNGGGYIKIYDKNKKQLAQIIAARFSSQNKTISMQLYGPDEEGNFIPVPDCVLGLALLKSGIFYGIAPTPPAEHITTSIATTEWVKKFGTSVLVIDTRTTQGTWVLDGLIPNKPVFVCATLLGLAETPNVNLYVNGIGSIGGLSSGASEKNRSFKLGDNNSECFIAIPESDNLTIEITAMNNIQLTALQ